MAEIAKNDFNLNISRYVSTATSEEVKWGFIPAQLSVSLTHIPYP